jgi:hypothetical protein
VTNDQANPSPSLRADITSMKGWETAVAIALVVYIAAVSVNRFWFCLDPYVAETDWKQWIWQYWRYALDGAFPAGHVITDYTFNAQPPLYHLAMSTLTRVFTPVVACNIVNWFAWLVALTACVLAMRQRTHLLVGLVVAALFVHDADLHRITMGGYPRSFGPPLVLCFLAAWLNGRHRLTLVVMMLTAAIYPSVCVPAGLAYGVWTALTADRTSLRSWLKPNIEVVAAGVVIAVVAQLQSLTAPDWWGSVVWAKDAGAELTRAGRTPWLPQPPFWERAGQYLLEPWGIAGGAWNAKTMPWSEPLIQKVGVAIAVLLAIVVAVRQKRSPVPMQMGLAILSAVVSFWLARELSFKLYLPHRMVQHTLPSMLFVTLGFLYFAAGVSFFRERSKAAAFVVVALFGPHLILQGDGFGASGYTSYAKNAPVYEWIKKNSKVSDQFGGYYRILDEVPFFAARQIYVNWKMAHPFRKGYFEEIDRRTVAMYDAFFCTDVAELLRFMNDKEVQYFIVKEDLYDKLEGGDSQLFEPMRSTIERTIFGPRQSKGFALRNPPAEIVVFQHKDIRIISRDRLSAYVSARGAQP